MPVGWHSHSGLRHDADLTGRLRSQPGWRCAQAKAACAEVKLVHAGHGQVQIGWRQARPDVQIAEDLLADARILAEQFDPKNSS